MVSDEMVATCISTVTFTSIIAGNYDEETRVHAVILQNHPIVAIPPPTFCALPLTRLR